ncbi:MAG TPA: ABC transporter ATP-binding protein [Nitrospiria bacterium]
MIRLENITKVYRSGEINVQALGGVSFEVARGEFLAIVGSSGSGKTTLLDILGGLSRPSGGEYRFDGRDIGGFSDEAFAEIRNRRIGFVFQTFHLLARQTALQNVELPLFYAGVGRSERLERAREALDSVGLSDRLGHTPAQLSGGQQQRVAIARALVNRPDLILADEPTGNLDSRSGLEIIQILRNLHGRGHTIIMITHDRELAERSDRIITLRDGRVTGDRAAAGGVPVTGG